MERKAQVKEKKSFNIKELKEIVEYMKKSKVSSFRVGEIAINFHPSAFFPSDYENVEQNQVVTPLKSIKNKKVQKSKSNIKIDKDSMTDEDWALASV